MQLFYECISWISIIIANVVVLNTSVKNSKIIMQRVESQLYLVHHTTKKQVVLLREQLEHANHCGRKLWQVASVFK